MARRWLLGSIAGLGLSLATATGASAQELSTGPVDLQVATVEATADPDEPALELEASTDLVVEEADTTLAPTVEAAASPEAVTVEPSGTVEVAGTPLPIPQVPAPLAEPAADDAPPAAPVAPPTRAAGSDVTPAPAPAPAGDTATRRTATATVSADRAAARAGLASRPSVFGDDALAPLVAPADGALPLVAAAAPTVTDLALPVLDPTPTVPGVLRLLAGLLVVGAAATWRTVRAELA